MHRIFYCASGPGDLIESHRRWTIKEHNPTEVAITFSGQIQDFCHQIGAKSYFVSTHPRVETVEDGDFVMEHRPKRPRSGLRFHLEEIRYGLGLLRTARKFGADTALIDSGSTHHFVLTLFKWCGIKVIPILHNTLWPTNYPPVKPMPRLVLWLDRFFWNRVPHAVLAVSPECERQVDQVRSTRHYPILQVRAQFLHEYFAQIAPAPDHTKRPFTVMFIGRVERIKGVFDILEIAKQIEAESPGLVRWEICGRGSDLDELRKRHLQMGLEHILTLHGWTSLEELLEVYRRSHASIVPTRSDFCEGLAMTAAEAILAGRPLITNPVVPALELLRPASVEGKTNDAPSHAAAVKRLASDSTLYARLRDACPALAAQFYDRRNGLTAVLHQALGTQPASARSI